MGGARDAVAATSAAGGLSSGASTSCCGAKANQKTAPLAYIPPHRCPWLSSDARAAAAHSQYFNNRLQRLENWSICWDVREQPSGRSVPLQQTGQPIKENPKPPFLQLTHLHLQQSPESLSITSSTPTLTHYPPLLHSPPSLALRLLVFAFPHCRIFPVRCFISTSCFFSTPST